MVTTIFILIYFVISSESFNPLKNKKSNIKSNNHHHHHYSQSTTHIDKLETMSLKPSLSSKCQQQRYHHHRRKLHNQNDEQDNLLFDDDVEDEEEDGRSDSDNQDEKSIENVKHYYYLSNDYRDVIKEDVVYRRERRHKHNHRLDAKKYRSLPDETQSFHLNNHHHHHLQVKPHWPVKHEAVVEGDVILGGLMMVHSREDTITCGPIMPQGGIQALEAMLYTIDVINKLELLPNITLGAHILDDCDKDSYGLEMAVDFIKGIYFNIFFLWVSRISRMLFMVSFLQQIGSGRNVISLFRRIWLLLLVYCRTRKKAITHEPYTEF